MMKRREKKVKVKDHGSDGEDDDGDHGGNSMAMVTTDEIQVDDMDY